MNKSFIRYKIALLATFLRIDITVAQPFQFLTLTHIYKRLTSKTFRIMRKMTFSKKNIIKLWEKEGMTQ